MNPEINVVAIAEAKPGHEAEVAAAIRACVGPTRRERGCRLYSPNKDLQRPARFVFVERWENQEALNEHMKTPHFLNMAHSFETLLQSPLTVLILQEMR
jgi:quinol monooxygenase YgiN